MTSFINEADYNDPKKLIAILKQNAIALTPDEAVSIKDRIGRLPSRAELFVFNIEWSEHCSYKSSKRLLKEYLPIDGRYVIQGPEEDAGIVELCVHNGEKWGIVFAHESHNHPSQVLPFEGAATGVGGIVRDVDCMGASVIGVADSLRFGDPNGKFGERSQAIAEGVVEGIYSYGNALGVPNLGGDTVYHEKYDDNCLVNVIAIGLLRESEIIHSRVPPEGEGYDLILIGKPTDRSGFGGAAFASGVLDQDNEEENKGAVQVPDPFLKNVLLHYKATHAVKELLRQKGVKAGMKDLGAGGIACCASEIGASGGFGVDIQLENVHISEPDLPAEIILCAETQERYIWAVPPEITPDVLRIYNEEWELPTICAGAGARVIGKVIKEQQMRVTHHGEVVVDLPIEFVVEGIQYKRESKQPTQTFEEPTLALPDDWNGLLFDLLKQPNICSKDFIYRHYDTEVQGRGYIRPGEADAAVFVPLDDAPVGAALAVDGNPFYGELSPYWGAATAVAECMRNIAAVGATPRAMTDNLNYGNPEKPEDFWALEEGVKGLADAARNLYDPNREPEAVPFVSGNVSLYNHSTTGLSIPPSPIVACIGVIEHAGKALTLDLKQAGNLLVLVGERYDELGGSAYYQTRKAGLGANVPQVRFEQERGIIYGTIAAIDQELAASAHDISNGGLALSAVEMMLACHQSANFGVELKLSSLGSDLRDDTLLFSESGGMVLEVDPAKLDAVKALYKDYGHTPVVIGKVTDQAKFVVLDKQEKIIIDAPRADLQIAWRGDYSLTLAT
ncbi:MAG: phosphoribosylformylglycinamidine synthase subunit PurL [Candidatus Hinthialibacter antarcticus]|nr:phosphoribosylformylglycinamidine synthase subunit PurL [Candidatus Hinthialibacter antarcticus]